MAGATISGDSGFGVLSSIGSGAVPLAASSTSISKTSIKGRKRRSSSKSSASTSSTTTTTTTPVSAAAPSAKIPRKVETEMRSRREMEKIKKEIEEEEKKVLEKLEEEAKVGKRKRNARKSKAKLRTPVIKQKIQVRV